MTDFTTNDDAEVDAVVIGSGLAGMTVALQILENGGSVTMIEKEAKLGGNSIKASSGMNACVPSSETGDVTQDEIDSFIEDTLKSAGDRARPELIRILVENSAESMQWLQDRLDNHTLFENRTRLGGHSNPRTHRPAKGTIGFNLISAMQKALEKYPSLKILTSTRAVELIPDQGRVVGVKAQQTITTEESDNQEVELILPSKNVVLATGGFAAARGDDSYLAKFAPQYLEMPATFGEFSTGDGISMAEVLGAEKVDMDKVQIHPTGFVDLEDPDNPSKILCAELMRGVGGILLNKEGKRFCNELGTRDYVTGKMMEERSKFKDASFYLLLPSSAKEKADAHIGFYTWKGLLRKLDGVEEVSKFASINTETLRETLSIYRDGAVAGNDPFGKTNFPDKFEDDVDAATYYVGCVTPVMHYCMGGLKMSTTGEILDEKDNVIPGLYGAGEVTGGVHGNNRLAGNSLLECLVFGRIVGKQISDSDRNSIKTASTVSPVAKTAMDAIQAKYSAVTAGYNPMVADRHDLYQNLLEDMMSRIEQVRSKESPKRRNQTALVNAGYASRVLVMSHRIQSFLLYHQMTASETQKQRIQLVFLGCGLDVIGLWAAKSFNPSSSLDLTVVEVDTQEICQLKHQILKHGSDEMVENLIQHDSKDSQRCFLGKIKCIQGDQEDAIPAQDCCYHDYVLFPADLTKETSRIEAILQDPTVPFDSTAPTLIVSELVMAYLPPAGADKMLTWCAKKFAHTPGSAIVAIEPFGWMKPGDKGVLSVEEGYRRDYCRKFQDKMQRGRKHNDGGKSAEEAQFYPIGSSIEDVTQRLQNAGFPKASTTTLGIAATITAAATSPDKTLVFPEMFDEHAALSFHLQSYVVTCGVSNVTSKECDSLSFGRIMCPWESGAHALKLARSCLPWFDCFDKMVYSEIQLEHEDQVRRLFERTYEDHMGDYPAIRKMVKGVLKKELKETYPTASTQPGNDGDQFFESSSIAEFYRSNNGIFLVAVRYGIDDSDRGNEVVGFVGVRTCEAKDVEHGTMEIFRLAVDERYRGRGIARNLLAAVEMFAMDQGCPKLVANTLTILEAACNLYASHGFVPEKETTLGPQLDMATFVKVPFTYAEDEPQESTYSGQLEPEESQNNEQSDYDRLGYEQAEPTVHQRRRRGSLLGHIMAWADTVNEEHMDSSFGQLKGCETPERTASSRPRRGYNRRGSMDNVSTDGGSTRGRRNRRRVHSSDAVNDGSESDENAAYVEKRLGSKRRNSLDAFVEQAVAYRNLRADDNDDELNPFGARRDSLF